MLLFFSKKFKHPFLQLAHFFDSITFVGYKVFFCTKIDLL